jgi:GDPmannose 4,6-dehydratase
MTSRPTALITGIAGQDGSYLAELLLDKGYRVAGVRRPGARLAEHSPTGAGIDRLGTLASRLDLFDIDLLDATAVIELLTRIRPREVYNLAGHSFVPSSWDHPELASGLTGLGASRMLEAIKAVDRDIRFYQASSSEVFGNAAEVPQSESTPFNPRNPYGEAKKLAHEATSVSRERDGLFALSGILFNHESPRRGLEFVTRKVTDGAARIFLGLAKSLPMGSLDAERDWGFAGDYVRAMWLMVQQEKPSDYVVASGLPHTVQDLCRIAFARVGLDYQNHVITDPTLVRPPETFRLIGDASKARRDLGWSPTVSFDELIELMVDADVARYSKHNT